MNKMIIRGMLFSICGLAAAAFCSCAADDINQTGIRNGNGDEVLVTADFGQENKAMTRAIDGLDTSTGFSLLTSANSDSKINIMVDDGTGNNYASYAYSITGATAISAPATPPYFPAGQTSVNVYGWYPYNDGNTSFTVQNDQQTDANYCLSDLMVAAPTTCTRVQSAGSWNVTPAALSFAHKMAKMKVVLVPSDGVTITDVKIKNVKKTVAITASGSPLTVTVGDASGEAGDITLLSGGSITPSSSADSKTLCGVFPAQSVTGNLLEITASYGGFSNTITYTLGSAKAFAQGQLYCITANVGIISANETVSITDWAAQGNNPLNISVGIVNDPAAMRDGDCIALNPLYWVAQYNVKTIEGVTDPETSSPAAATEFYTYHAVPGNVYLWYNSEKTGVAGASKMTGYHLPSRNEQVSVIPSNTSTDFGYDIFLQNNTSATNPFIMTQIACDVAGTAVPAGLKSYFLKNGYLDYYAVRFVDIGGSGSDYASAWHYRMYPGNGLAITSYMLATKPTTDEQAKQILAALPYSPVWEGTPNVAPHASGDTPPTGSSLVTRFIPATGFRNEIDGIANVSIGISADCQSSDRYLSERIFHWRINSNGNMHEAIYWTTTARSVRLFRDNFTCSGTDLASSSVGDLICEHGRAHDNTSGDLPCGGQKVAIVAYLSATPGTPGDFETDTHYTHGLALALTDCPGTHQWDTENHSICITGYTIGNARAEKSGIANTNQLAYATGDCSGHTHAAAQAAVNYESTVHHPGGTSNWFLPTLGQWNLMVKAMCNSETNLDFTENPNYYSASFNTKIISGGGTGVQAESYWSSTRFNNQTGAWVMVFGEGRTYDTTKISKNYVRAVFAF